MMATDSNQAATSVTEAGDSTSSCHQAIATESLSVTQTRDDGCDLNQQTPSNKRKLLNEADENDIENTNINNDNNNSVLDEASAQQLRLKLTDTLKRSLVLAKLEKLKEIHNECIQFVNEEHYLKSQLAYIDYPKWSRQQAQQPVVDSAQLTANRKRLAELESRVNVGQSAPVPVTTLAKVTPPPKQSIAERARHEANILQRISKLRKEGLWSIKRLPKLVEPARPKTHWDYLLDEMLWMSTDFQQERKWKINCSKKISLAIQKYFKDKQARVELAEKEEIKRVRKQASLISREIQVFWRNVEKIIEYKQNTLLEEKRKHVMDMHLKIIVNQTEKYSNWLMESLNQRKEEDQSSSSITATDDDKEFKLNDKMMENFKDDESTIEEEEKNLFYENNKAIDDELEKLRLESELPLDDLLKDYNLDSSYFNNALANNNENKNKSTEKRKATESSEEEEEAENDDENEEEADEDDEEDDTMLTDDEDENECEEDDEEEMMEDVELDELVKPTDPVEPSTTTLATTTTPTTTTGDDQVLTSIAETAQSFQPTGYTLETTNVKTKVPSLLLKHDLREYQHVGLDWLVTMYENKLNGILADEMGLGKTIQTIALLAHLAQEKFIWGPHLIVVPTSVILNWELEFKKWAPGFKILTYYGSTKERRVKRQGWTKMNAFHVCITSYKLVIQDHAAFRRKKWKYFILDEAQNIKNFKSQRWQSLLNFQSQRRLLLTGTPLQNNLMELWSLMHFLMPHVFSSHKEFQHWFSNPLNCMIEGNSEYNEQLIKRLHKVLRPFILRRLKSDVEKQMPKKYEHVIGCKLSKRQRYLYDEFMSLTSTKEKLEQGNYISVINILMQLRKVCNHPDLFESRPIVSSYVCEPHTYTVPSSVFNLADELTGAKLENILFYQSSMSLCDMEFVHSAFACHRSKRLQTPRKLIEEIMVSVPQLPITQSSYFSSSSYNLLYSNLVQPAASQPLDSQPDQSDVGPLDEDKYFLQTTLEGVESNRLKKCVKQQEVNSSSLKSKIQYLVRTNRQRCSFTKPMYGLDLHECVTIEPRANTTDTTSALYRLTHLAECTELKLELSDVLNKFVLYIPSVVYSVKRAFDSYENNYVKLNVKHPNVSQYTRQRVLIEQLDSRVRQKCPHENRLLNLVELNQTTQFPEKRLIEYDCGKLQTMSVLLRRLYTESHRVLIFTQMTRMLDVLENFLNYHGYKYLRLDGSTGIEKRQCLMERFNNDRRIFCMILSTRSGGIGVNLTGADTVVFYDSDWNPTMDAQAQDRCHRIGQTRDVNIYRLISEKTIEENILRKANQKRLLNEMTIEGGCFTTALLKRNFITELFEESPVAAELSVQVNSPQAAANTNVTVSPQPPTPTQPNESTANKEAEIEFEKVLALVEDESDVKAAKELREEVKADCAEFDENEVAENNNNTSVNNENDESIRKKYDDRVENEFKSIEQQLKPIERYALKFLESYGEISLVREDEQEMAIEKVKQDWELNRLKRLKEEEERKAELDDDDMMIYTYTKAEVRNRHASSTNTSTTNSKRNKKKKDKKNRNKKQKSLTNHNNNRRDDVKQRLSQRLSDRIKHSPAPTPPPTALATTSSSSSIPNKKNKINKRKKLTQKNPPSHSQSLNSVDKPATSLGKAKSTNDLTVPDDLTPLVTTTSPLQKETRPTMMMTTAESPGNTLISTSTAHSLPSTSTSSLSHSPPHIHTNTGGVKPPKSNQKENKSIRNLKLLANAPAHTDSLKLINNTLNEDSSDGASESDDAKPAKLPDKVKKVSKTTGDKPKPKPKSLKELKKRGRKPKTQLLQASNLTNQPRQESNLLSNLNDQIKNMITVVTPATTTTSGGELLRPPLMVSPAKLLNEKPKVLTLTTTNASPTQVDFRPQVLKTFVRPLVMPTTNQPLTLPKASLPIINLTTTSSGTTTTTTFSRSTPSTPIYITKLPTTPNTPQPVKSLNIPTVPKLVFKTLNKPIVLPGVSSAAPGIVTTTTIAKPPSQINIPRIITTINLNNNANVNK